MSIEVWKVDYDAACKILTEEIWIDSLMEECHDYNEFMAKFNEKLDAWIRKQFWTDGLQALNSSVRFKRKKNSIKRYLENSIPHFYIQGLTK